MKQTCIWMTGLFSVAFALQAQAANLATVNGKVITDEDLNALVANLPQYQKDLAVKDANTRKQLIQDLVDQELMVQDATIKKIDNSKEFKDALNAMRKQALVNGLVQRQLAPKVTT